MAPSSDTRQLRSRAPSAKLKHPVAPPPSQHDDADNQELAAQPYSTPRLRNVLLLCLGFRAALGLVGQRTFFQPDEYYQSLEPAHRLVWGTGYETWEWRASALGGVHAQGGHAGISLPKGVDEEVKFSDRETPAKDWRTKLRDYITQTPRWRHLLLGSATNDNVSPNPKIPASRPLDGLLRSWVWPLLFALPYWTLKVTGLDKVGSLLILAPRIPMIILAALTDFYTYRLAGRVLGKGYREAALFLSLLNLFNAHALTRTLTTSAETCLTVIALYYWPLPLVAEESRWRSNRASKVTAASLKKDVDEKGHSSGSDKTASCLVDDQEEDNLALSLTLSAIAFVLRPTNIVLWSFLGSELCVRSWKATQNLRPALKLVGMAVMVGTAVILASVYVDFAVTGRWYFPFLTFLTYNVVFGIANFYGSSAWHYHVTQSIPILLSTALPFFVPSLLSSLGHLYKQVRQGKERKAATLQDLRMRLLTSAVLFTLTIWSCIGHKEWRFLHPLLPILLLYPARYLVDHYQPPDGGLWVSYTTCAYSFLRINRCPFLFLLLAPILPYVYLSGFHGRAQIEVTDWLRRRAVETPNMNVLFVMPCHSTPWISHVHLETHLDEERWHFLTCEPPLSGDAESDKTEVDAFYRDDMHSLDDFLQRRETPPTHIVLFGSLYAAQPLESQTLTSYDIVHSDRWNGFDVLQDDARRRGGIFILQSREMRL